MIIPDLDEIRAAISGEDAIGLTCSAHALLSSLGAFGAKEAERLTRELEEIGRAGKSTDFTGAGATLLKLEREIDRVSRAMERLSCTTV